MELKPGLSALVTGGASGIGKSHDREFDLEFLIDRVIGSVVLFC